MGHLLPVLNFATGWQGQSRAVVLTQTDIRVIAFASGQPPTPPSVAIPNPRFVFWGDGNQLLLKKYIRLLSLQSTPTCFSSASYTIVALEYGCFSAVTNQSTGVAVFVVWLIIF